MILTDPVWLEEPLIQTTNYRWICILPLTYYPCTVSEENISTAVPHFLPGTTAFEARGRLNSPRSGAGRRGNDLSRITG